MITDISLHGNKGPVEFFAYVRGEEAKSVYFYDETPDLIRFFSRGSEFTFADDFVKYKGTGGSFCQYMFGMEKPRLDIMNKDIVNRLMMFGALVDETEKVFFSNDTEGTDTYANLFMQGHAVRNYFFFVASNYRGDILKRQKQMLGKVGKLLKRTELTQNDIAIMDAFYLSLDEPGSTIFTFKLIHKGNEEFYDTFKDFYFAERKLTPDQEKAIAEITANHNIDYYQQERMKIDIMYKHPDNRVIVDEYRDILIDSAGKEFIQPSELARLRRLKTLRIRHNITSVLFETLDELLLKGRKIKEVKEPVYLREARSILGNLFFKDQSLKRHIINEDIIKLIKSKNSAYLDGDMGFEQLLLEVGRMCDEVARETKDYSLFEDFSSLVTYFDRYDHVQASMSKVAFSENSEFTEDFLRSQIGNKKEFDVLDKNLYRDLFVKSLYNNKFITAYGKKKIKAIADGMDRVATDDASLRDIVRELSAIVREEKLYQQIHAALKEALRSFYPHLNTKEGRGEIRGVIIREFQEKGISEQVSETLFEKVFLDLKKESYYLNNVLPVVIKNADNALREDFLQNSGLDRFYLEGLEKDYFEQRGMDVFLLNLIREDKELMGVGGGERI